MSSLAMNRRPERRTSKRHPINLHSSISITNQPSGAAVDSSLTVLATTLDVSLDGLALIVPPSSIVNTPELSVPGQEFRVWLALPFEEMKTVEMKVTLVRPASLFRDSSFLVCVRIKEMSALSRAHYNQFISRLNF